MWILWMTINGTLSICLSIYLPTHLSLYLSTWQSVLASLLHAVASEVLNKRCGSCCLVNRMEEAVGVTNHQAICDTELCFVHPAPQIIAHSSVHLAPQIITHSSVHPAPHHPQFCFYIWNRMNWALILQPKPLFASRGAATSSVCWTNLFWEVSYL